MLCKCRLLTCLLILFINRFFSPLITPHDASPETSASSARQYGVGKVKTRAQGGAPFCPASCVVSGRFRKSQTAVFRNHTFLQNYSTGERTGKRPCSEQESRGLADKLKVIFSCRSFVSDLCPAFKTESAKKNPNKLLSSVKDWALANCVCSLLKVCFLS